MPEKVIFFCLFKLRKRRFYDLLRDFYIYRSYTCFFIKKIWKKYMTFNAFFFQKSHMVIFREIKNMTFFDDSFIKSHTRAIKRPTCGAWLDAGAACGADRAFQVCAGQLRNGRLQGHQPLCPYPAGEVLRCDR